MILFSNKEDCYGCTACKTICPNKAIKMQSDEEGFLYPTIDKKICTECGLCITVCPSKTEVIINGYFNEPKVYAVKHNLDSVRMMSSSGGAYTAISDFFVLKNKNGVCYGASFDNDFYVCHNRASTLEQRDKFRGSKYVQSDLKNILIDIRESLIEGKSVLFTGTPCQTAGLLKYLERSKTNTSNLLLNDIICHGVPSPKIWKDYIEFIQEKNHSKLINYTFRYKEKGWRGYNIKAEFESGQIRLNTKDILKYIKLYKSNLTLRPSCYYCKFANLNRPSDIMIGDFWGIEKSIPEFGDEKGVSLVFVNTKKGKEVLDKIENSITYKLSNTINCLQPNLHEPTKKPMHRKKFWSDYNNKGFNYIIRKYTEKGFFAIVKISIMKTIRKIGLVDIIKMFK